MDPNQMLMNMARELTEMYGRVGKQGVAIQNIGRELVNQRIVVTELVSETVRLQQAVFGERPAEQTTRATAGVVRSRAPSEVDMAAAEVRRLAAENRGMASEMCRLHDLIENLNLQLQRQNHTTSSAAEPKAKPKKAAAKKTS